MDSKLLEHFAATYPKASQEANQRPRSQPTSPANRSQNIRTPLSEILSKGNVEGYNFPVKHETSGGGNKLGGNKKLIVIVAIAVLGAFLYSALAYTWSDHIFGTMGMELFDPNNGQPGMAVIGIHTLVFMVCIWVILKVAGAI